MAWLAIDKNKNVHLYRIKPYRDGEQWKVHPTNKIPFPVLPVELSSAYMWLNRTHIGWEDEPIEI